ncbi:hypothetical protein [Oscillatoria acuminata]|uniref:SWIM-type domain-containing protein n=1 Tax=Oscillatoria acuminata PCC 6304 TaxID=56110 RepID=K9TJ93_9CYAN|nr:hypothetical protein [Oscillatoria acuminata]AFY82221.1 hypothetical protein Oscil6304_2604 [Oscillatoria acuminata PCC 6304]
MNTTYPQPPALENFSLLQLTPSKPTSKRLPQRGKQSLDKAIVSCPIEIERLGIVKRTNTPYIVYRTPYGRGCTFIARKYLIQSLLSLLGIRDRPGEPITGISISEYRLTVQQGETLYTLGDREVFDYLERQNQAAIEALQVKLLPQQILVWNSLNGHINEVNPEGCSCYETSDPQSFCKHQVAAHLYLRNQGWGALAIYFKPNEQAATSSA